MTDILIIDDDERLDMMLSRSFALEGHRARFTVDGADGLKAAIDCPPDVIILDWMLPGMDGLEVCRRLRSVCDVPILMLTAKDAISDRVSGLRTGADDYLVKPFAFEELLARVEALRRRDRQERPERLTFADVELDTGTRTATRNGVEIPLTTTEYELLSLFLRHPRQVLKRDLIMERVWGYDFSGESNILEVYVGYLRKKLEQDGASRLIQTVRGAGYVLREL